MDVLQLILNGGGVTALSLIALWFVYKKLNKTEELREKDREKQSEDMKKIGDELNGVKTELAKMNGKFDMMEKLAETCPSKDKCPLKSLF